LPQYCVWRRDEVEEKEFWVLARSEADAKRLVALNVPGMEDHGGRLDCAVDSKFNLCENVIISGGGKTFTVSRV
jgi:hypothetical protein